MPGFFQKKRRLRSAKDKVKSSLVSLIIFTLLVGLFDGTFVRELVRQWLSTDYPDVTGKIVDTSIGSRISSSRHGRILYFPVIYYRYQVSGQKYTGSRYRYVVTSAKNRNDAALMQIMADHLVGAEKLVFYNPVNPQDSLLVTGVNGSDEFRMLFYGLLNVGVLAWWSHTIRNWKKKHPAKSPS